MFASYDVEHSPGGVSKGTNWKGQSRQEVKSYLERQKKAEKPFLPGSWAHQQEKRGGAVGPTPVLPEVHSLGMNVSRRGKLEPNSQ